MNFIRATVADGGAALAANGLKLPAPATARGALASRAGKAVIGRHTSRERARGQQAYARRDRKAGADRSTWLRRSATKW